MTAALPMEWNVKTLRDLADINYGRSPAAILAPDGRYPVVGTGGSERLGNAYLHDGESIILGRKGTIDRVHFVTGKFWTIDTAYYLTGFAESVPKWLFYFLQTLDLRQMNEATGVPSLSRELLYKIKIPAPAKPEQTKIAEILSVVDRAIEQTEALIAKQQRIKTGLMQGLLTRGIDEHGNLRSETTHKFKDSLLGRIPMEWEIDTIGNLFNMQLGKMLSKKATVGKSPAPYVGNKNVQWDSVDLVNLQEMDFNEYERKKYALCYGDLLVCEGGEVGRTAMWRSELQPCFFQKAIHRLRPKNNRYLPGLLLPAMRFASITGRFADFTSQTSIAHLTQEKLAQFPLAVPPTTPRNEQEEIIRRLEKCVDAVESETKLLRKLFRIKGGLMQDLLTGKRRVTPLLQAETPIKREMYVKHG